MTCSNDSNPVRTSKCLAGTNSRISSLIYRLQLRFPDLAAQREIKAIQVSMV
jgi:hypothetical protein